ncbi:efflux RND transporter permease subunit [Marinobacter sp.]|uniref:efflux RND transporter permease subunit n=1 Tax=Marinobacter sp. TaxID=50741 RepID=UPI00384E10B8
MFEGIVRHGVLVTVATLLLCILGIAAALKIPVQMIPDLEVQTVTVITTWPGATPQDIEKEILIEQEEYLRNIPSLERMISNGTSGQAEIELEFPFNADMTETLIRVNNALSQVPSYPLNVDEPRIIAAAFSANAFMYFRVAPLPGNPRNLDMNLMRDFIDERIRTPMETVPGVSQVELGGGAERQIRVLLDPARLAENGLTVMDVRDRMRARNQDVSGGELESGKRSYLVRTVGRFENAAELENLVLARRGDRILTLGDVAKVEQSHYEVRDRSFVNGQPVLSLAVRRVGGSNVIDIKERMMATMDELNEQVLRPAGMEMGLTADDVVYVSASIANVWTNLAIGALFATLVMFLFLRSVRGTAVGVVGIPICTIAAFLGLLLTDRTINVISLAGVAFAIGMTIDNSIVVLESIERERRRGLERFEAAVTGVRQVWPAVLASTLTTVLVFLPIVFLQVEAGQLYGDIAIAISASILASMLVAITLIPTLAANMEIRGTMKEGGSRWVRGITSGVSWLTAHWTRRLVCILATVGGAGFIILVLTPPAAYLPEGEEAKTFASMNAPPGYNLETMTDIGLEIQDYFMDFVGDDPEKFARGETEVPAMDYLNLSFNARSLRIISETTDPGQIDELMTAITRKYEEYPGMRAFASRGSIITGNQGGTRAVSLDISGPELPEIYEASLAIYRRANEVFEQPRIQTRPTTLTLSQPLVEVRPDWKRAAELGMDAGAVGLTVAALTDGAFLDELFLGDDKVDIFAYGPGGPAADLAVLDDLPVHTPNGTTLPLTSIARIVETVDTSTVRRVNSQRTVTLNIIPPAQVALETGVQKMRTDVLEYLREQGKIPANVNVELTGASDQLTETREALMGNYAIALLIVYLLLTAIFTHWGLPLLIMTTIPMGIASGIVGLVLMNTIGKLLPMIGLEEIHQPFDMISMLGFLILLGTVVNNPILIVHRAVENLRQHGTDVVEAVNEAVEARLRPIVMSTLTTLCGLSPLVFFPGEGTELYRGVGAIVLFGLLGTAVVALTFLPSLTVFALRFMGVAKQT